MLISHNWSNNWKIITLQEVVSCEREVMWWGDKWSFLSFSRDERENKRGEKVFLGRSLHTHTWVVFFILPFQVAGNIVWHRQGGVSAEIEKEPHFWPHFSTSSVGKSEESEPEREKGNSHWVSSSRFLTNFYMPVAFHVVEKYRPLTIVVVDDVWYSLPLSLLLSLMREKENEETREC